MNKEEFLFLMYKEYGKAPELTKRYIDDLEDYSNVDRESLAIKIESAN